MKDRSPPWMIQDEEWKMVKVSQAHHHDALKDASAAEFCQPTAKDMHVMIRSLSLTSVGLSRCQLMIGKMKAVSKVELTQFRPIYRARLSMILLRRTECMSNAAYDSNCAEKRTRTEDASSLHWCASFSLHHVLQVSQQRYAFYIHVVASQIASMPVSTSYLSSFIT